MKGKKMNKSEIIVALTDVFRREEDKL